MNVTTDERPGLETRIVGGVVIIVLLLAVIALYVFPDNTAQDFAWTIKPRTTAILIGEGYLAGAVFFVRVITGKKWQRVQTGFLPITVFTISMLAATLLHWDRFHQGTFIFYFWTVIYAITPLLVPFLWWRNRARDTHTPEEKDVLFSMPVRWALGGVGAAGVLLALAAFIWPAIYITITPWKLTELTARIFAGWSLLSFCTVLSVARDGRWSATRLLLQSVVVGQVLTLLSLPRMWNDLDPAKFMTYVFVGGLATALVVIVLLYLWLERKSRRVA
jgi:hypothetical protein